MNKIWNKREHNVVSSILDNGKGSRKLEIKIDHVVKNLFYLTTLLLKALIQLWTFTVTNFVGQYFK